MEKILCRKCKRKKAPFLFTPADVKNAVLRPNGKLVSTCRGCRKDIRSQYAIRPANPTNRFETMRMILFDERRIS